jgi:intracellular protein transport protein USO1
MFPHTSYWQTQELIYLKLVEPINAIDESDVLIPGLCVFLLGACYEFNREPGEATRETIHPILSRLGVDTLSGRLLRAREDTRLKNVSPEGIVQSVPSTTLTLPVDEKKQHGEIWFDWSFVEFWRGSYCKH